MTLPIYIVDAFTDKKFSGNQAGVCILDSLRHRSWMQSVAAEMNLAETAFVHANTAGTFDLKWFAPSAEVALCGHATLAASHILWSTGLLPSDVSAEFDTLSGRLSASKNGEWIDLDFPSTRAAREEVPDELLNAVGVQPIFIGRSKFDVLLEVETDKDVLTAAPDFSVLLSYPEIRGVIVTARSLEPNFDFVSRFFAPNVGMNEDPATGSTHCCLGPYWGEKLGKSVLTGKQLSKRGGVIKTQVLDDRVKLSGQAVTVVSGQLHG